ncbi:hypothetical protein FDECE_16714, partial [Fusarium decemcellulare]
MSNPMDSEPPTGNASSSNASAPKKPSIRVLDPNPEAPATREEDLDNGPLLLGFGVGVVEHEHATIHSASHPGLETEFEGLDHHHHHTETGMLLEIPSGLPTTSSIQTSELSDAGPLYSVPTVSQISEHVSRPEAHMTQSTSDNRATGLFVRGYEFSWENSRLWFAGEPFDVVKATEDQSSKANPDPETVSAVSDPKPQSSLAGDDETCLVGPLVCIGSFHDSVKSWVETEFLKDLEIASLVPVAGSSSDTISVENLGTQALDPQRLQGCLQNIDWLVEILLEHFFRSRAPQRSGKRNSAARKQAAHPMVGDQGTGARTTSTPIKGKAGARRGKTVDGSGDSEDEESRSDGQGTSSAGESKSSRSFACPFLKWWPQRKKHTEKYCMKCYEKFGPHTGPDDEQTKVPEHGCLRGRTAPTTLITTDKLKGIRQHGGDMRGLFEKQWYRLYEVLFPKDRRRFSPYLNDVEEEMLRGTEEHFHSEEVQMLFYEEAQGMDFGGESLHRIYQFVYERFLPRALFNYVPNGEVHSYDNDSVEPAHDNDRAIEHSYPSGTLDPNVLRTTNPEDTDIYDLQQPNLATTAQEYLDPALTGSMLGVSETQTSLEGIAGGAPPNATEIGDLELSGPDDLGLVTDGDVSHLLWSEGHQT